MRDKAVWRLGQGMRLRPKLMEPTGQGASRFKYSKRIAQIVNLRNAPDFSVQQDAYGSNRRC